ncbi:MAG: 2-amino-4-hydroxy-6-hydroxymethyldihydropteridine diphosphokinase [Gammaproteobacteria bacterium]
MSRAWISIGSNIAPERNVGAALELLAADFGTLVCSPAYRTPAVGFEGEDFLNMVVGLDTDLSPPALAQRLREIEDRCGRVRGAARFSARTLDLDLLSYDDRVLDADGLVLPRPEILEQAFVLGPLADVAPDDMHPLRHETYAALWRAMNAAPLTPAALPALVALRRAGRVR